MTAVSYGRSPAIELRVPAEYGLDALPTALVDVGPIAADAAHHRARLHRVSAPAGVGADLAVSASPVGRRSARVSNRFTSSA